MPARRRLLEAASAVLLTSGCATAPLAEQDECDRLMASDSFAQFDRLAVRERVLGEKVVTDHRACSADPAALAAFEKGVLFRGLHSERTVEGGKCVRVEVPVDPNAESAAGASHQICAQAHLAKVRYESWSAVLGGINLLYVSGSNVMVRPIPPRPVK